MPPSTPPASDTGSASQTASQARTALTALTNATDERNSVVQLVRVHSQITKEFEKYPFTVETRGILNKLNQSILSRLKEKVTERQSRLTEARKAYTDPTGEPSAGTTGNRLEPRQTVTKAEANELLEVFREAQKQLLEDNDRLDENSVMGMHEAYGRVLANDELMASILTEN